MDEVKADSSKHRVEVIFAGAYSGEIAEFTDKLKDGARVAKAGGRHFDMLTDFTQSPVMPQTLLGGAADAISWCAENGLRKAANVVSSMLMKMQLDRLTQDEKFKTFLDREEAEKWLDE